MTSQLYRSDWSRDYLKVGRGWVQWGRSLGMTSSALYYYIDECMTLWEASFSDSIRNKLVYHILQTPNHLCCLCPNLSISCILERKLCDMHVWLYSSTLTMHALPEKYIMWSSPRVTTTAGVSLILWFVLEKLSTSVLYCNFYCQRNLNTAHTIWEEIPILLAVVCM